MSRRVSIPIPVFGFILALCIWFLELAPPFFHIWTTEERNPPIYLWHVILAFTGLAVFLFSVLFEIHVKNDKNSEDTNNSIQSLKDLFKNSIEEMGPAPELLNRHFSRLCQLAEQAHMVQNTLIFFSLNDTQPIDAQTYVTSDNEKKRFAIIEKVVGRGHIWKDLHSERGLTYLDAAIKKCHEQHNGLYQPRVMNSAFPVVNLVLFQCGDYDEVWFGFGLFNEFDNGPVFRSVNPNLCEYFDRYFNTLQQHSHHWDSIGRQDIEGSWVSVAYGQDEKLQDCAVVVVALRGRSLCIEGKVFIPENNTWSYVRKFYSTSSSFETRENKALLDFTFIGETVESVDYRKGGGAYVFDNLKTLNSFNGNVFSQDGQARRVYGRKFKGEYANIVASQDITNVRKMIKNIVDGLNILPSRPPSGDSPFNGEYFV